MDGDLRVRHRRARDQALTDGWVTLRRLRSAPHWAAARLRPRVLRGSSSHRCTPRLPRPRPAACRARKTSGSLFPSVIPGKLEAALVKALRPIALELPFKVLLFVAVDGWGLLARNLLLGYRG